MSEDRWAAEVAEDRAAGWTNLRRWVDQWSAWKFDEVHAEALRALLAERDALASALRRIADGPCVWSGDAAGLSCLTEGYGPCFACQARAALSEGAP